MNKLDKKTQILLFISASSDRKSDIFSTTDLAKTYGMTYLEMRKLLDELVREERLARIMVDRKFFYGPTHLVKQARAEVEEEIEDGMEIEMLSMWERFTRWFLALLR